jgi:hypothetical protein
MAQIKLPIKLDMDWWWFCFKISFFIPSLVYFIYGFTRFNGLLSNSGICHLMDCSIIGKPETMFLLSMAFLVAGWFYISEKWMIASLTILSIASLLCLSYEQSSGITTETGMISLFFIAQLVAYGMKWINNGLDLEKYRLQFPKQIVVAVYTLSGISKLIMSGTDWFTKDSSKFALEVFRVHYTRFSATGIDYYLYKGQWISAFLMDHPFILSLILFISLALEIFSGLLLINQRVALLYGFLLLLFHLGILIALDISYPTIMWPMVVACINPLFWAQKWVSNRAERHC